MDATDLPLSTKHFAGKDFALPLKKTEIKKYKDTRLKEAAARATINRELSALRRGLALAVDDELVAVAIPKIEKLPENNVRTSFVDDETYHRVAQEKFSPKEAANAPASVSAKSANYLN